ncbi:predicted protein [Plenodomus lingam JN3]|uniref:Predicted protein n=1 Tax=Leptosphaeria maculans (strain JN3 / isolate v23.1.3 / race Av1-4-5-6-7-8) TaxID=985895 RepID=E4ZSY9_LEPMJ|nr:predicted protein [Plenodomus lingam JN3]CBX94577.1 predicted protein [Plenodomus lingam JN3]
MPRSSTNTPSSTSSNQIDAGYSFFFRYSQPPAIVWLLTLSPYPCTFLASS